MSGSDRIKRSHARVLYINYIIQKYSVDKGIIRNLNITSGDFTEGISVGPTSFTPVELNSILMNNNIFIPELLAASGFSVPTLPQNLNGTHGNTTVTLTWAVSDSDGGFPITKYSINVYDSVNILLNSIDVGLSLSYLITNLTNGFSYTFTVVASNLYGNSLHSLPITLRGTIPGAPVVSGESGNTEVVVSWREPYDSGLAITNYRVTAIDSSGTFIILDLSDDVLSTSITGLTNGTPYTFTVVATNVKGSSPSPTPSAPVTPSTVPDAPTAVSGDSGNTDVVLSWARPYDGGSAITNYIVTAIDSSGTVIILDLSDNVLSASITGLTNGTPYTFTVVAMNVKGSSNPSTPSDPVTPSTVPDAPTAVSGDSGNKQVIVSWAPPYNGGSAITNYRVTSKPGGLFVDVSGHLTTGIVTGLTNGPPYTFTVVATNIKDSSLPSTASSPVRASNIPGAPTAVSGDSRNAEVEVSWTPPSNIGGATITNYRVTAIDSSGTVIILDVSGNLTSGTVQGLSNGTAYTFTVFASNLYGISPASLPITVTPSA